jgi:hypothetical protein
MLRHVETSLQQSMFPRFSFLSRQPPLAKFTSEGVLLIQAKPKIARET